LTRFLKLGLGSPRPVKALADVYDGSHPLYWSQSIGLVNSTPLGLTPEAIIEHMSTGLSDVQRQGIQKKDTPHDIAAACPQNFNGHSQCYAAIVFTSLPPSNAGLPVEDPIHGLKIPNNISYTIQADAGLSHVDVRGQGDFELRHMPIQMALDHAIIALSTNMTLPVSKEWPFTHETNEFEADQIRLCKSSLPHS
jgi:ATP-binding cassette subfamily A (ABC1) protein 3